MHDFRVVKGKTHCNLVFDVTVPAGYKKSDKQLIRDLEKISELDKSFYA